MKNNKILIILLVLFMLTTIGLGGYIVYDKYMNTETNTNNSSSTGNNSSNEQSGNNSDDRIKLCESRIKNFGDYKYINYKLGDKRIIELYNNNNLIKEYYSTIYPGNINDEDYCTDDYTKFNIYEIISDGDNKYIGIELINNQKYPLSYIVYNYKQNYYLLIDFAQYLNPICVINDSTTDKRVENIRIEGNTIFALKTIMTNGQTILDKYTLVDGAYVVENVKDHPYVSTSMCK